MAVAGWSGLLTACKDTLSSEEAAGIRNDVAVSDFHLGHRSACLEVLAPLRRDITEMNLDFLRQVVPSDY